MTLFQFLFFTDVQKSEKQLLQKCTKEVLFFLFCITVVFSFTNPGIPPEITYIIQIDNETFVPLLKIVS